MRQSLISLSALLVAILLILLLVGELDQIRMRPAEQTDSAPDIVLSDARLRVFDQQGKLQYRVSAAHIEHHESLFESQLRQPDVTLLRNDGQQWRVRAATGQVDQQQRLITLSGNVSAELTGPAPVSLHTSLLHYRIREQQLDIPAAVEITHPGGSTAAGRLFADITAGTLDMSKGVETRYAP